MTRPVAVLLISLLCFAATPALAQEQEPPASGPTEPAAPASETSPTPPAQSQLPSDPRDRLEMAAAAFRRADYALLVPLLEPIEAEPELLADSNERVQARELLVVGYYFLAQQVKTHADRDQLLVRARTAALEMLRDKPDHILDSLVFPVSIVDLVEDVRRENSEELDRLLAERQSSSNGPDTQTIYLERVVEHHPKWVNFLPFAAGQFQNGQLVKGTLFAILQGTGLAVNALSYWMILRLRDPETGNYTSDGGQSSNLAKARRWRQVLYGGLGGFAGAWIISTIDGWLNHESDLVRIRTLDAPPPELNGPTASGDAGLSKSVQLGLSLEFRW